MAEPEGAAEVDDGLDGAEELEGLEELEDGEFDDEEHEELPPPPRRRLVSELLEGQDELASAARPDLQLVAPPLHAEVGGSGQPIYQLDLSSDEPEGTLLEPTSQSDDDYPSEPTGGPAAVPAPADDVSELHAALRQMVAHRDRQVMAAERDGIGAYELAAGIDAFVAGLIEAFRRS